MDGPGHGGPRKGMKSFERKLNSEAAKHAVLLETHIPDPTPEEIAGMKALIARNARSNEEREMFEAMLLGMAKCSCGQTYVVQSLARDCESREHTPITAGEGEPDE